MHVGGQLGLTGVVLDQPLDAALSEAPAVPVQEEGAGVSAGAPGPGACQAEVALKRRYGGGSQQDDPLAGAFAQHPGLAVLQLEVRHVQAGQLTHPDTGGVQQLQDGPVTDAGWRRLLRRLQQGLDAAEVEELGESLLRPCGDDALGGICLEVTLLKEEAEEGPQGAELAGPRCGWRIQRRGDAGRPGVVPQ